MKTTKEKRVSKNKAPAAWSSEERDIATVIPYEKNPRKNDQAVGAVAESIRQFGFRQPIVVDAQGVIIAGHTRLKAAQLLGLPKVPVHVAKELTPEQVRALRIADNKLHELAQWDVGILASELEGLVGMEALGFDENELKEIAFGRDAQRGLSDPDEVPEPPDEATTKPGDLWVLGNHRLLCGDSTKPGDVARLLGDSKPELCVTDPPYGVNYNPQWRSDAASNGHLAYAARRVGKVANDDRADWRETWALFPGSVIYSWHPPGATSLVHAAALQDSGFAIRMQIIWAKSNFPIGRGDYHVRHEPCWYAVREGRPSRRNDDRTQTTLWSINLDKNVEGGHSTQKPVECMARPIRNHLFEEVYEPFAGSGTTLIACEMLGRRCFAIEIEPKYCDVVVNRWEKFTGRKAERATG